MVASDRRSAAEIGADDLARDAGVELRLCDTSSELPSGLDAVVTSPGVSLDHPLLLRAAERGVPVVAEVELAWSFLAGTDAAGATVVGITGTGGAGKSSLTDELVRRFRLDQGDALKIAMKEQGFHDYKEAYSQLRDKLRE